MALSPTTSRGSSALTLISDSGELTGAAASVDIQNIAATYIDLLIVAAIRSTRAAQTLDTINLRLNNDSGANYYQQSAEASGATVSASEFLTVNQWNSFNAPAASSPAGVVTALEVRIASYASTVATKTMQGSSFNPRTLGAGTIKEQLAGAVWNSTAAVNRVTVTCANGNLDVGSRVRLYGFS